MNKLRLNNKIHNHIVFMPLQMDIKFDNEIDEQMWAGNMWEHVVYGDLNRHAIYIKNKVGVNKHMITVWSDEEYTYLVVALRTEWNTTKTTVYMQYKTQENIDDFKAIAKFVHYNIDKVNRGYKDMIYEARDYLIKNNIRIADEDLDERKEHSELN